MTVIEGIFILFLMGLFALPILANMLKNHESCKEEDEK